MLEEKVKKKKKLELIITINNNNRFKIMRNWPVRALNFSNWFFFYKMDIFCSNISFLLLNCQKWHPLYKKILKISTKKQKTVRFLNEICCHPVFSQTLAKQICCSIFILQNIKDYQKCHHIFLQNLVVLGFK
jgi:hypothetical protein